LAEANNEQFIGFSAKWQSSIELAFSQMEDFFGMDCVACQVTRSATLTGIAGYLAYQGRLQRSPTMMVLAAGCFLFSIHSYGKIGKGL
jgi:hypothetical protein